MLRHPCTITAMSLMYYSAHSLPVHPPVPPTVENAAKSLLLSDSYRWSKGGNPLTIKLLNSDFNGTWNTLQLPLHVSCPEEYRLKISILTKKKRHHACTLARSPYAPPILDLPLQELLCPLNQHQRQNLQGIELHLEPATASFTVGPLQLTYKTPALGPKTSDETLLTAMDWNSPELDKALPYWKQQESFMARKALAATWRSSWYRLPDKTISPIDADTSDLCNNTLIIKGKRHSFGECIDWLYQPEKKAHVEWPLELNCHAWWPSLGSAYVRTGHEIYAKTFVRQLRSWIIRNPLPAPGLTLPRSPWNEAPTAYRMACSWPQALPFFVHAPSMDDSSVILLLKSVLEHGQYLHDLLQQHSSLATPLALYRLSLDFPLFQDATRWQTDALNKLPDKILQDLLKNKTLANFQTFFQQIIPLQP